MGQEESRGGELSAGNTRHFFLEMAILANEALARSQIPAERENVP
jgi:hypothetical protein